MSTGTKNRRVAVIGGDGIGPEVCAEALKVVAAAGVELETTEFDLGAARYLRDGTSCPTRCSKSSGATTPSSSAPSGPGGRHVGAAGHPRAGPPAPLAVRPRPLREPPSLHRRPGLDRRRSRLRRHPGEHRRDLCRRGRVPAQGDARRGGHPGVGQHPHGGRAMCALCLRAGDPSAEAPPDPGAQDQRPHLRRRSVASHRDRGVARIPRRLLGLQPRRCRLHLPGGAARAATTSSSPTTSSATS